MRGRKDPRSNLPFKSISEPNPILHERRLILVTLAPFLPIALFADLFKIFAPGGIKEHYRRFQQPAFLFAPA